MYYFNHYHLPSFYNHPSTERPCTTNISIMCLGRNESENEDLLKIDIKKLGTKNFSTDRMANKLYSFNRYNFKLNLIDSFRIKTNIRKIIMLIK